MDRFKNLLARSNITQKMKITITFSVYRLIYLRAHSCESKSKLQSNLLYVRVFGYSDVTVMLTSTRTSGVDLRRTTHSFLRAGKPAKSSADSSVIKLPVKSLSEDMYWS